VACGLAMGSAAVGLVALPGAGGELSKTGLIVIAIAAMALFGIVAYRFPGGDDGEGPPLVRLRKMTFLWLALAAVTAGGMMKPAIAGWVAGGDPDPGNGAAAFFVGCAVLALVAWRGVTALRSRGSEDDG